MELIKAKLPGILVSIAIAVAAMLVSQLAPLLGSIMLALIFGMMAGNSFLTSDKLLPGLKFSEGRILECSIILLGFGFEASNLERLNSGLLLAILSSIFVVMLAAFVLGRWMGISPKLSLLLGAGSAICGSAAIAAVAPAIDAKDEEVGLSIGVVNLLGLVGLALLPSLSFLLHFSDFQSAILLGGTLQSVGHVAASAFAMNTEVGELAMMVKMTRVVFIIPLLIILYLVGIRKGNTEKIKFPLFIFLFAGAVFLAHQDSIPKEITAQLTASGHLLMTVAMAAIGVGIRIKPLLNISGKGIALGSVLFLLITLMITGLAIFVGPI